MEKNSSKSSASLLQAKIAANTDTITKTWVTKKKGHVPTAEHAMTEMSMRQKTSKTKD